MIHEKKFYIEVCKYQVSIEEEIYQDVKNRSIEFREPFSEEVKWDYSFNGDSEQTYEIHILEFPKVKEETILRIILRTGVYRK